MEVLPRVASNALALRAIAALFRRGWRTSPLSV
jgi:hypothetical protein